MIPLDAEKHTEIQSMEGIDPACVFLGNRPALRPVQENRQYTGVVEPGGLWPGEIFRSALLQPARSV